MKKLNFTLLVMGYMAITSMNTRAQIAYSSDNLIIKNPTTTNTFNLKIDNWRGMYWTCNGRYFQLDVSTSSPRLAGKNDEVVFYNSLTNRFNSIQVANVYNNSDERTKENVKPITSGLDMIMQLKPVSYNWKREVTPEVSTSQGDSVTIGAGPSAEGLQFGFLAQEVERIIPDAVKTTEDGHKLVNYNAIFTVLVQAVQQLEETVDKQSKIIEQLVAENANYSKSLANKGVILSCSPNPTYSLTTINTQLGNDVSSASIIIRSLDGQEELRTPIPNGTTSVTCDCSRLKQGIHIVTLLVNGTVSDAARLIKE